MKSKKIMKDYKLTAFDLFSGCGGFRLGAVNNGIEIIAHCEIDRWAKTFYNNAFNPKYEAWYNDATKIKTDELSDFNILLAGFPCQSFSIAGKRQGFEDSRGSLFFEVLRILQDKRPEYFVLENVKGLLSIDNGKTFQTILKLLSDIGIYSIEWAILNSKYFGVPQNRERIFIVGYPRIYGIGKIFPINCSSEYDNKSNKKTHVIYWKNSREKWKQEAKTTIGTLKTQTNLNRQFLIKAGTYRTYKDNKGMRITKDNTIPAIPARQREDGSGQPVICYPVLTPDRTEKRQKGRRIKKANEDMFTLTGQDRHGVIIENRIRRLTPLECFRLQGFPDEIFKRGSKGISDSQLYKMAGNSVTVNVVTKILEKIVNIERR